MPNQNVVDALPVENLETLVQRHCLQELVKGPIIDKYVGATVDGEVSAVSAGTELAVYTGTHQWLKDPNLPEWKFPFRSGYSAAGTVTFSS